MLDVKDLHAYYGKSHILRGVNLKVGEGEIVSLLGRNGGGRSTACKAIMGLVRPHGTITFRGEEISGKKAHEIAQRGLGYVPEDRQIFPSLTVKQNLQLGLKRKSTGGRWSIEKMYELFPRLGERQDTAGGVLSGGEKQMLTLCRTLMGDPDLIMVDEPTEGLAPMLVEQMSDILQEIAARGVSVLLIEQKLTIALKISNRLYVMGHGQIVFEGTPQELSLNEDVRKDWLQV